MSASESAAAARRRPRLEPGINLTPMLDMIFNLLFFFVLATQIRTESAQMDVRLPKAATATPVEPRLATPSVTLDPQGSVYFQGRTVAEAELALELRALARSGRKAMVVRGDERTPYGRVVEVMDLCKQAGLTQVELHTRRPDSAPTGGMNEN